MHPSSHPRQKEFIRLSRLRELLSEDTRYSREAVENLYDRAGCAAVSGMRFEEVVQAAKNAHAEYLHILLRGPDVDQDNRQEREQRLLQSLQACVDDGTPAEETPEDFVWRSAAWHWIIMLWAGIVDASCPAPPAGHQSCLTVYYRTETGRFEPAADRFCPNWHHCVTREDVGSRFKSAGLEPPAALVSPG